jgi:signal transduction histidine kinase/ligand-binding sensor domain-containing protein/CheY-like chemotaxis protein/AraC-like DNA-binding protein
MRKYFVFMPMFFLRQIWLHFFLVTAVLILAVSTSKGQGSYNFRQISTSDGLSSNTILSICQDRNGLMWFGTPDGVNKYDGSNVTLYRHVEGDPKSLPANEAQVLYKDRNGRLWIGTGNGLCYYDDKQNSFVKLDAFKHSSIRSIYVDHSGNLWAGSYSDLRVVDANTGKIFNVPAPSEARGLENVWAILSLCEDNKHQMWIGSQVGAYKYNYATKQITSFVHNDKNEKTISNNYVTGITQDSFGQLWFGTLGGLNKLLSDGKSFKQYKEKAGGTALQSGDIIHVMKGTSNDQLWIGTEDGLRIFNVKTETSIKVTPDSKNVFSLKNSLVKSIYTSSNGIYWIGLENGGVNELDKNLAQFNLQLSSVFNVTDQSLPIITSFEEHSKGLLYVGTLGAGLQLFDKANESFKPIDIRSSSGKPIKILSLKKSRNNMLWIGTFEDGVYRYNPANGQYKHFFAPKEANSVSQNVVYAIEEDRKGNIWIGTNGKGVIVVDNNCNLVARYYNQTRIGNKSMPINGFIRSIAEDRSGDIWLASHGSGIAVYHPLTDSFTNYIRSNSGLASDLVLSILHDKHGKTWIGTNNGLSLFKAESNKFVNYTERNGLANNVIYKVIEDDEGLLWMSTNKGISSFNAKTKQFKNYTTENGVQNAPFFVGSGILTSTGELFFGGESGFNYFKSRTLPTDVQTPAAILTDLKVSNNSVAPGDDAAITAQINLAKEIDLKYGQNFSLDYVALNYTSPHQNQYSYKLIGFDKDWNMVGGTKTAKYTNLDPGNYTFQVRASNSNGTWTQQPKSITIKVSPPWWRAIYAYVFYVLAVIGALYFHRRNSIRKIMLQFEGEKEKIKAEELLNMERMEAERIHEMDMMKIKFLTNLSHEFRTPISLILAPVDKLLAKSADANMFSEVNMIKRNARRLLNLVSQLLDFRKMEECELKLNLSVGDIVLFVKEAAESFQDLSERKKIRLNIESEIATLLVQFDHDKIERIIFNLLSNAFKFTLEGGQIDVHLFLEHNLNENPQTLCLEVSDNGIGMAENQQEKIFDRFFQSTQDTKVLNQGSGIGLSITKEFVNMHGGNVVVNSKLGIGTTFLVTMPVITAIVDSDKSINKIQDTPAVGTTNLNDAGILVNGTAKPIILIVEDNADLRFYLKENLRYFYQIIEASDGKEGWQKALSLHPHLVVSDISMPVMDGIELTQKIKGDKRTSHIPIILLTAITGEREQIKGLKTGANDYLTKPFNVEILAVKIKNLLDVNKSLKDIYSKQIKITTESVEIESKDVKLMRIIRQYIEDKINDPALSVEELGKHAGVSRGTLYRKIIELTGMKPVEYIRDVKLDKAIELLEKSDLTVSQIAYMTGFASPNYFARTFKAKYKMIPSDYANVHKNVLKTKSATH